MTDGRLLEAVRSMPRAEFVPADEVASAYRDTPVPLPHGQVTTQPSLIAMMVSALGLTGDEQVLEVGTGCDWQTALLARMTAYVVVERGAAEFNSAHARRHTHNVGTGTGPHPENPARPNAPGPPPEAG
ncbi:protein-L-isoaspartate O-methyltransferase family protein [Streptomyces antibioticus]|uniref:protein-L-isoaspartate O-methyltransferase family protein n=1 Tax=Streptomyces antibioticus TaxID=1890 RepID=UPI003F4B4124